MKLLYITFLLAAVFPYVQILPVQTYNQPYALVLGLVILVRKARLINAAAPVIDITALAYLAASGVTMLFFAGFPELGFDEIRYLLNYISPLVIGGATFAAAQEEPDLVSRALKTGIVAWLTTALVQTFVSPSFMSFAIGSWSEVAENVVASGRGVVSLAPEPTHHGFNMLLLAAAASLNGLRREWIVIALAEAVALAVSSSAILAIAMGLAIWTAVKPYRLAIAVPIVAATIGVGITLALAVFGEDSRLVTLALAFAENPQTFLTLDLSVNMRLGGLISSTQYMVENGFYPHGLDHQAWLATAKHLLATKSWLLAISEGGPPSGFGVILFQLGFLALPVLFVFLYRLATTEADGLRSLSVTVAFAVFIGQYFIASPGFGLVYGLAMAHAAQVSRRSYPADMPCVEPITP